MTRRKLVILGLALATLLATGALVLDRLPGANIADGNDTAAAIASAGPAAPPAQASQGSMEPTVTNLGSTEPGISNPTRADSVSPDSGTGHKGALEMPTPTGSSTRTGLPSSRADAPLITGPLPTTGTAQGSFVDGFPSGLIPLVPRSGVVTTSVSSQGAVLQVGLTAAGDSSPAEIEAFYQSKFVQTGFTSSAVQAPSGSTATRFSRGGDSITLTVTAAKGNPDGKTGYTIFGVIRSAG